MSDRETIVQSLAKVESRIRTNRRVARIGAGLAVFILFAILVKFWDLVSPFSSSAIRGFWVVWFAGLAAFVIHSLRFRGSLSEAAAEVDQRASLKDEVVSAYWFVSHNASGPWIDLHVRRAAETVRKLNLRSLYPRIIPHTSYVAVTGTVLLLALNFAPLQLADSSLLSWPAADLSPPTEAEALFNEIEELLSEAEALRPDPTIDQFQDLIESMREARLSTEETEEGIEEVEGLIDEGNLNIASILEGLEEMGADLLQAEDTAEAGQALLEGELDQAAEELRQLAQEIADGQMPAEEVSEALEEASENSRSGLEELVEQLREAAEGLRDRDQEAAEEALIESAESLGELSAMVESQRLQNEAADRLDTIREALREQLEEQAETQDLNAQDSNALDSQGNQQELTADQEAPEDGVEQQNTEGESAGSPADQIDGPSQLAPGPVDGVAPGDELMVPALGDLQNIEASAAGQIPVGFGFSPEQKEGAPTSLEVQLQEEIVQAALEEITQNGDAETKEETTGQELSVLDYRNVPSDLTPAQQDLLNEDRIPREYRNLIKEYFEAIRPRSQP